MREHVHRHVKTELTTEESIQYFCNVQGILITISHQKIRF